MFMGHGCGRQTWNSAEIHVEFMNSTHEIHVEPEGARENEI